MYLPGRKYQATTSSQYRYTINGQEKENELNENITTAEYWMYDSRVGRRWNLDPVIKANESPYAVFGNNPVWNVDPNGADTLKYLSNNQALDAMKLASKTLKTTLDKKQKISTKTTSSTPSKLTSQVSGALVDAASDYAQKNKLSYQADAEFNNLVQDYADGLRQAYLFGGEQSFNGISKYLNSQGNSKTSSTYALRRVITRVLEIQLNFQGVVDAGLQAAMIIATAGVFPEVGAGPKGTNPRIPFVPSGGTLVEYNGGMSYIYRGENGSYPLFQLKGGEYKYTNQTVRGVSVNVDAPMLTNTRGAAYQITDMPTGLKIVQQGKNAGHFEIIPTSQVTQEQFQILLNKIKYTKH